MKVKVYVDRVYILEQLKQIIAEIEEKHRTRAYSSVVENAITELIKIEMRELAHRDQTDSFYVGERILFRAVETVQNNLRAVTPRFDSSDYFKAAQKKLRVPAFELSDLRTKLRVSKEMSLIGNETAVGGQQSFCVKELGLKGAIEGLLVFPLSESVEIDLDKLSEFYSVEGDWFPYQVKSQDLTFVVDDDGSIFTSTEHFSERLLTEAKEHINKLANTLYA